jgi:hypothetical protein
MTFTLSAPAVADLAAQLPGKVSAPGDADWDQVHRAWMLSVAQQPCAVVHVSEPADVVAAVRIARRHGLSVAAQPIGHGATTAISGTILLRTRGLQEISVDPEQRVARVGAGVKWGELLEVTARYGLTGLAGSSSDPSVVGFSVSGGLSWFGRAHGLAAHSIRALDVVDASGELRRITAESDPDLFWAVCGGGGDFAVVTAVEITLFPAPQLYGGRMMWPIEMAWPVLRAFRDIAESAPDELTLWAHLLRFPPLPELPEFLRGQSFVTVDSTFLGSAEDAEALLEPLRHIPAMHADTTGYLPVDQLSSICAEPVDPMPVKESSGLLTKLDDAVLGALLDVAGHRANTPLMVVQVRSLGGALARGRAADGPSGAVDEPFQLFCLGVPMTPELGEAIDDALVDVYAEMAPYLSGRTFFTFLGSDADPSAAFSPDALTRLRAIKAAVDPDGVIRSNRPV